MKKIDDTLNRMYLFNQYKVQLSSIIRGAFEFSNVPLNFKGDEIVKNLINNGYSCVGHVFEKGKDKGINCMDLAVIGGVTEFSDMPQFCTYTNPINDSRTYYFDSENENDKAVLIRSTYSYLKWSRIIDKYALLLADADITTDMSLISLRVSNVLCGSTDNSNEKKSITMFFQNLIAGKLSHVTTNKMIGSLTSIPLNSGNKDDMIASTQVKNNILRQFYREIGISMSKDKSQAILYDEKLSDEQNLLVNQSVLFDTLKEGIEKVNEVFGTNIEVKIKESYLVKQNVSRETFTESMETETEAEIESEVLKDEENQ